MSPAAHSSDTGTLGASTQDIDLDALYDARFSDEERRRKDAVWAVLCADFFQKYVRDTDTVMDIGAGLGEFLRHIRCGVRIAVDVSPMRGRALPAGTVEVIAPSHRLGDGVAAGTVDVVFCSNFFEHLPDKATFLATLHAIRTALKPGGRLLVLQPNIRALGGQYLGFRGSSPAAHGSNACRSQPDVRLRGRRDSPAVPALHDPERLPQAPWLVRIYLRFRPAWWLLGGQAWLVARKSVTSPVA